MFQLFANNAKSTLSVAVTTNSQATLTMQTGAGAKWPQPKTPDYCYATLDDGTNVEVVKVIDRSTDALTVLRGMEGTTAQASFAIGTKIELRPTADSMDWIGERGTLGYSSMVVPINVGSYTMGGAMVAPTIVGSTLARTLTMSNWLTAQPRLGLSVADSAQQPVEVRNPVAFINGVFGFRFKTRFGFSTLPNSAHFWTGLVNTTGQVASVCPPSSVSGGIVCGFVGSGQGANLSIWRADSGGTATQTDLGSYFTANSAAWYQLEVDAAPQDPTWYVRVRRLDISSIADFVGSYNTSVPHSYWLSPYLHMASLVNSRIVAEHGGWSIEQ